MSVKILIIGPQGVGKSTMAHEILAALKMGNLAHTAAVSVYTSNADAEVNINEMFLEGRVSTNNPNQK